MPTPTRSQVADVARRTAARIETLLRKAGRSLDPEMANDSPPQLSLDEPGLAACYAAAAQGLAITGDRAGQPPLRLITAREPPSEPSPEDDVPAAEVRGVNVYAKQCVDGRDRRQLERFCKWHAFGAHLGDCCFAAASPSVSSPGPPQMARTASVM